MGDLDDIYGTRYRKVELDDTMSMYTDDKGNITYSSKINDDDMMLMDSAGETTYVSTYDEGDFTKIYSDGEYYGDSYKIDKDDRITRNSKGEVIAENRYGVHTYYSNKSHSNKSHSDKSASHSKEKLHKGKEYSNFVLKCEEKRLKVKDKIREDYVNEINSFNHGKIKLLKLLAIFSKQIKILGNIFLYIGCTYGVFFLILMLFNVLMLILGGSFSQLFNWENLFIALRIGALMTIGISIIHFVESYLENMIYVKDI